MCHIYSITINQASILALFRVVNRCPSNLPPVPGDLPNYPARAISNTDAGTEMNSMRFGTPLRQATGRQRPHCFFRRTIALYRSTGVVQQGSPNTQMISLSHIQ